MSSVPHNPQAVKPDNIANNPSILRWRNYKRMSQTMSKRLYAAGLKQRAARMYQCGEYITTRIKADSGEVVTDTAMLCRDRLCPLCSWRLSMRRFAEMMAVLDALQPTIENDDIIVSFLTLTVRNVPLDELRRCIDAYAAAWNNMSRRTLFKGCVGWSRSLEITYNAQAHTYHPHYHILMLWRRGDYTDDMAQVMQDAWRHAYGCDYKPVIDVRQAYSRHNMPADKRHAILAAALEAYKYAVKPDSAQHIPQSDLAGFASAIAGVRMVSYGKCIKRMRTALGFHNDDTAQPLDVYTTADEALTLAIWRWTGSDYIPMASADNIAWRQTSASLKEVMQDD